MSSCQNFEAALRSDFKSMRVLATCSICDQLLYEPWTIACGHTYCYSCLCSWFSQDKRKKSCPECRSRVKVMPAPSFLIKQLVEVILKRSELLLADESVESHQKKRAEEVTIVDNDRNSSKGLFKGMFTVKHNRLWRDNADGVMRCSGCGFEYEGGSMCSNCGEQVEVDEDYDYEAAERETMELESMGFDLDPESDEDELFNFHDYHHFQNVSSFIDMAYSQRIGNNINHFRSNRERTEDRLMAESDSEGTEFSAPSDSSESEIDDEDDSSLQGFIAPEDDIDNEGDREENSGDDYDDDGNTYESTINLSYSEQNTHPSSDAYQTHINIISDDESDEGGAISNRRQRRRQNNTRLNLGTPSPIPSVITLTDTGSNYGSEDCDQENQAENLRRAGWSPLDHGNESDKPSEILQNTNTTPHASQRGDESDENTETLIDRNTSDDDNESTEMGNCNNSRLSIYESSSLPNSPQFYEFSESSSSQSTEEDRNTDSSNYWTSRNLQIGKNQLSSHESHMVDEEIPYTEDIHQRAYPANNGRRRKRSAWESSTQDPTELESVDTSLGSRRSKAWALSRMRNNFREAGQNSRARNEEISSSQESNTQENLHQETIGLANVLHEDAESDDSIHPPSRRRLRHHNSFISSRRFNSEIIRERRNILSDSHKDNSSIPITGIQRIESGLRAERLSTYRKISLSNVISRHFHL